MPATFTTASHTGLVRRGNEDAAIAQPPVYAVADGMGGAQAGEIASGMAVAAIADSHPEDAAALSRLAETINQSIFEQATGDAGRAGMGTTLTAALTAAGRVDFVHVGDSRAYRLRDGKLEQLSADHSLVGEMIRTGELTEAEALKHPQRSIITRALGVDSTVEVDSFSVETEPGDLFLLCSDGLYSMVAPEAIETILRDSDDLAAAATSLVEAANGAGGEDNVTVVIFSPDGTIPAGSGPVVAAETRERPVPAAASGNDTPRWRRWYTLAAIALALIAILAGGSWYMTRQIYYLGVNDGRLSIYQGLPVELGPLSLSTLYRQSNVPLDELEPFEQDRVLRQELSSLATAEEILENYTDQGQTAPQQRRDTRTATTSTGVQF